MPNRAQVFRDRAGEWRWRIRAANGRVIADSGESYHHKADAIDGLTLATSHVPPVDVEDADPE